MQQTETLFNGNGSDVNGINPHFDNFAAPFETDSNGLNNNYMQNKRVEMRIIDGIKVRLLWGYRPAEILKEVRKEETLVAYLDNSFKVGVFSVMQTKYNADYALPDHELFIHMHSKVLRGYIVLVTVTKEQRLKELTDRRNANEWKKRIPRELY